MKRLLLFAFLLVAFAGLGWAQCNPTSCVIDGVPPDGFSGVGYSFQFSAHGGSGQGYTFDISSNFQPPPGLSLNSQGLLSGTPTTTGPYQFQVRVRDSSGGTGVQNYTMNIFSGGGSGGLQITNPPAGNSSVSNAVIGQSYFFQFQASGGTGSYTWSGFVGVTGLSLNSFGQITGTPSGSPGTYQFNITATDANNSTNSVTRTFFINVSGSGSGFQITTVSVPNGTPGVGYQFQFTANGSGSYQWSTNQNQLPPGLTLSTSGVLSGTPTTLGGYNFTVSVLDFQMEQTVSRLFNMQISTSGSGLQITTTSVPNAALGVFYSFQFSASGCVSCFWSLLSGSIAGLNFTSDGVLSGTPTTQGVFNFTVQVSQSSSFSNSFVSDQRTFSITVTSGRLDLLERTLPFGVQGQSYSSTVHGTGGGPPYFYSLGATDVRGLSMDGTSGVISGTPANSGNFVLPITVADSAGGSFTFRYALFIATPLTIVTTSLPNGSVGVNYAQTLEGSGGQTPFIWSISSGTLPPGITLDRTSGRISGSPTSNGRFNFTVQLVDAGNRSTTKDFSIIIGTPLSIVTSSLSDGAVGAQYSQTLSSNGGQTPVTWALASGSSLPAGLTLSAQGVISGAPTAAGTFTFTVVATDSVNSTAQKTLSINIVNPVTITTATTADGTRGTAYQQGLGANGGTPPFTWSLLTGDLPAGLILNSANGVISGTPTAAGTFNFTVQVRDSAGQTASRSFTIRIIETLSISANDASGAVGAAFNQSVSATGGSSPYTFSANGLPAGLSLNSATGAVTGTPTAAGSSSVTFTVTDSTRGTVSKTVTINIAAPPALTLAPAVPNPTPPARQSAVGVTIPAAFLGDITGTLTVNFITAVGRDDQSVRLSNGSRSVNFTIPAGQTNATFTGAPNLMLLTGTTAGTIVLTTTGTAGTATRQIAVDPGPPVLSKAPDALLQQGNGVVTVAFDGYSLTGELVSCRFVFSAATGSTLQTSEFTVQMNQSFATWMSNPGSLTTGTNFFASVPFTITNGASTSIVGVSVTCNNARGTSNALTN